MSATITKQYVQDNLWENAPRYPTDRPPTRKEVWEYNQHFFPHRSREELAGKAKWDWLYAYVYFVNMRDWRMPPDWVQGDSAPPAACPKGPIFGDEMQSVVYALLEAKEAAT